MEAKRCKKCAEVFYYTENDAFWDYEGMNYDAKLVKCPNCECINVIKYVELPNRSWWDIKRYKED